MINLFRSCKSPFQYLIKSVRYCDGGCAENTKCGPSTIPEEHLEVSWFILLLKCFVIEIPK